MCYLRVGTGNTGDQTVPTCRANVFACPQRESNFNRPSDPHLQVGIDEGSDGANFGESQPREDELWAVV